MPNTQSPTFNSALSASSSVKVDIIYNDKGLPVKQTSYYNNNKVSEETSDYSSLGELLSLGVKPYSETATMEKVFEYDSYGRVIKETNPANNSIEYQYNDKGQSEWTKDIYGKITSYEYDNFGRLVKTISPLGSETTVEYRWENVTDTILGLPAALYSITTKSETSDGEMISPETKVYFDAMGREIRGEQLRFDGSRLKTDKLYDSRGRIWKVSSPFKGNEPTMWNIYSYDEFDRPTSIAYASGKQDTWSYSGKSVTSISEGITTIKTYNAAGQLTKVIDTGGTITYNYRPDGQVEKVVSGGVTTSFTYDNYGRKLTIADPSAGTETLTYDAKGNIATLKDANNNVNSFVYDTFYRLTQKQMPEYTVYYGYDSKGNLSSINSTNGKSLINYTFDDYGRATAESETFEGKTLAKHYGYDGDRLSETVYKLNNVEIATENHIYENGYNTETRLNDTTVVWKITAENERGQTTAAQTGSYIRNYGFNDYGMPTERQIRHGNNLIQSFSYNFNSATGNLFSRRDEKRNITEHFEYDNLNRLITFGGSSMLYADNGNIQERNDMAYEYNTPNKPYAMSQITPYETANPNLVPSMPQFIDYTSFKRPALIEQDSDDGTFAATFHYNGVDERAKVSFGSNIKTFLSDCYEKDQNANYTKEKLYICGDYYSAPAVMVRENSGDWQLYYIGRDCLGSVTHVLDKQGNLIEELSYDAWGNLRDPDTQEIYAQDEQPNLFLGRGFTGHEHLTFCGLINMNARLYCPATGRFLSPDPYVQSPEFTQSYNRYSYAWNNPLRYIDPTGETVYTWDSKEKVFKDEDGNPVPFEEVFGGMMSDSNSNSNSNTTSTSKSSSSWIVPAGGYKPGYLYFNTVTRETRFIVAGQLFTVPMGSIFRDPGGSDFGFLNGFTSVDVHKFFWRFKNHYDSGKGTDIQLTIEEFAYLVSKGVIDHSGAKDLGNGYYFSTINFYNSGFDLAYSWGRADITYKIVNGNYIYNNIINVYDFDAKSQGERSWYNEVITQGYGILSVFGKPFNLYYTK